MKSCEEDESNNQIREAFYWKHTKQETAFWNSVDYNWRLIIYELYE